jgi:hypothetical protein
MATNRFRVAEHSGLGLRHSHKNQSQECEYHLNRERQNLYVLVERTGKKHLAGVLVEHEHPDLVKILIERTDFSIPNTVDINKIA